MTCRPRPTEVDHAGCAGLYDAGHQPVHICVRFSTDSADFVHLEGGGDTARYVRFTDLEAVESLREELCAIVAAWCGMRD